MELNWLAGEVREPVRSLRSWSRRCADVELGDGGDGVRIREYLYWLRVLMFNNESSSMFFLKGFKAQWYFSLFIVFWPLIGGFPLLDCASLLRPLIVLRSRLLSIIVFMCSYFYSTASAFPLFGAGAVPVNRLNGLELNGPAPGQFIVYLAWDGTFFT